MAKIMLVEDDNNLREIYEARLLAEGYEIVAAHDGEEALALAVKEKPDLIISDVMMPKISGFDMLDILRSTPETKYTKVIMMTALSQAEDKDRADKLGADRYLVKSQVTLEDVAKIAREVLEGTSAGSTPDEQPAAVAAEPTPVAAAPVAAEPVVAPVTPAPVVAAPVAEPITPAPVVAAPVVSPVSGPTAPVAVAPAPDPVAAVAPLQDAVEEAQSATSEQAAVNEQVQEFINHAPGTEISPSPVSETHDAPASIGGKKVVQPINDPTARPDLNQLLADEERKNPSTSGIVTPSNSPSAENTPAGDDPNLISL